MAANIPLQHVVGFIDRDAKGAGAELRALLYPSTSADEGLATPNSVGPLLSNCADKPVRLNGRTLILRRYDRGRRAIYAVHEQ